MEKTIINPDVISKAITVSPDITLAEATDLMVKSGTSCVVAIDGGKPAGIITERDVVRFLFQEIPVSTTKLREAMSSPVATAKSDIDIYEAYQIIVTNKIRHIVITDKSGSISGVVTQSDIIKNLGLDFSEVRKVAVVMTKGLVMVPESEPVRKVIALMANKVISCAVVRVNGRPEGIITEHDVARLLKSDIDLNKTPVGEVMSRPLMTVDADAPVHEVTRIMEQKKIRRLVVVDQDGNIAGLVTQSDIIKGILEGKYIETLLEIIKRKDEILKETEKTLIEKTIFLDSILHSAKDTAIVATDTDMKVLYYNPTAEKIFDLPAKEAIGRNIAEIHFKRKGMSQKFKKALEEVESRGEYNAIMNLGKGGKEKLFGMRISAIRDTRDRNHELRGYMLMGKDITEKKRKDELLSESVGKYYTLFENSKDTVYITSENGRIIDINQAGVDLFGYSKDKLLDIGIIPLYKNPNNRAEFVTLIKERNFVKDYEVDLVNSKGETIHTLITAVTQKSTIDDTLLFQGIIRDITESKHAELALIRKNRALSTLSQCNNNLVHGTTEEQLLNDTCKIITEVGGYRMAWAGYAMTDEQKSVKPIAHSGFEDGYLNTLGITWEDTKRGHGPVGRSIRTGQPVIIRNIQTDPAFKPWRSEAGKRGYSSVASLPLFEDKRCFGALNIYSSEEDAFDSEEIGLLRELANNLSFGILALRDRAERKHAQEKLERSLSLIQAALESTGDGILIAGKDERVIRFNKTFLKMWNIPDSLASRKDGWKIVEFVLEQLKKPDNFLRKMKELSRKPEVTDLYYIEFKDGRTFEQYSQPQMIGKTVVGRVFSFRDITERKRQEDKISFMAFHDPLTGLPNRRTFTDRLAQELIHAKRNKTKGAVMFMDLDRFKEVNDTMGHDVGDVLLQHVAMRIQKCLREVDTVSRIGGDEFVVVLSKIKDEEDSLLVARKIIETVKETVKIEGREINTTVSIGISIFPTNGEESELLIKKADDAMYTVKRKGRNNVRLYTQG